MTKPDDFANLKELIRNRDKFVQKLFQIEDKQRHIGPFRLNPIQQAFSPHLLKPGRHVIVKPSQVGFSSMVIAYILADTITRPGTTSVIVAHEEFITQRLLQKAQFFYDCLPEAMRPKMSHRSSNEKFFPEINSVMYIGSARAYVFGRGEVIHNFLADEFAFWQNPSRIMVPALQRVPADGLFLVLSTPNGADNAFHKLYLTAKTGKTPWQAHFYPWFMHPEYRYSPTHPLVLEKDRGMLENLTSKELELRLRYAVDDDQLRWRRSKIMEMESMENQKEESVGLGAPTFGQEFPEDDESCFLTVGDAAFDQQLLSQYMAACTPAPEHYEGASVWELPQKGRQYMVTVDPGLGIYTRSGITVWRFEQLPPEESRSAGITDRPVHCATHAERIDTEKTAAKAVELAKFYNGATLVIEANSHGLAVLSEVKNVHHYNQIYWRKDIISGNISTTMPGWLTTKRTKPFMVQELKKHLPVLVCKDAQVIGEIKDQRLEDGIVVSKGLSDLFMSTAIAVACRESMPVERGFVGVGGWGENW